MRAFSPDYCADHNPAFWSAAGPVALRRAERFSDGRTAAASGLGVDRGSTGAIHRTAVEKEGHGPLMRQRPQLRCTLIPPEMGASPYRRPAQRGPYTLLALLACYPPHPGQANDGAKLFIARGNRRRPEGRGL